MSEVRILLPTDKEIILNYAKARLSARVSDPMEREMQSWDARWRPEALDHYLPQGWCFGVFDGGTLEGFLLAQPFLFYRGLTQTLWIEHVEFNTPEVAAHLIDTAQRWARDKHLQCLLVENSVGKSANLADASTATANSLGAILKDWPRAEVLADQWVEIRSSRFR